MIIFLLIAYVIWSKTAIKIPAPSNINYDSTLGVFVSSFEQLTMLDILINFVLIYSIITLILLIAIFVIFIRQSSLGLSEGLKQRLLYLLELPIIRELLTIYSIYILIIRSVFIYYPISYLAVGVHTSILIIQFILGFFGLMYLTPFIYFWVGLNLISIDHIGSLISEYVDNYPTTFLATFLLSPKRLNSNKQFIRFISLRTVGSLLVGKVPMTALGRSTLLAGVLSGTGFLINSHFQRSHELDILQKDHEFKSIENQKEREFKSIQEQNNRNFDAWKIRHDAWQKTPWYRAKDKEPLPPTKESKE